MTTRSIGGGSATGGPASVRIRTSVEVSEAAGKYNIPIDDLLNAYSPRSLQVVNLASGANTITVPSGVSPYSAPGGVFIVPPSSSNVTLTLKGIAADTGIPMARRGWAFIPFDYDVTPTGPTSFVLNASAYLGQVLLIWV